MCVCVLCSLCMIYHIILIIIIIIPSGLTAKNRKIPDGLLLLLFCLFPCLFGVEGEMGFPVSHGQVMPIWDRGLMIILPQS